MIAVLYMNLKSLAPLGVNAMDETNERKRSFSDLLHNCTS
jgi:hypothetical protein